MVWKAIYNFLHIIFYAVAKLIFRYRAFGAENVPKRGSAILASNHASYLDPPFVGLGVWRRINYLAKKRDILKFCNQLSLKGTVQGYSYRPGEHRQEYTEKLSLICSKTGKFFCCF